MEKQRAREGWGKVGGGEENAAARGTGIAGGPNGLQLMTYILLYSFCILFRQSRRETSEKVKNLFKKLRRNKENEGKK